jgi:large subunit ribosomal protein L35
VRVDTRVRKERSRGAPPAQPKATLERATHEEKVMPKLKTKRGAAKRFRAKGNGGFKAGHSHMRHILTKKAPTRKRQLGSTMQVHESDVDGLRKQLPYA